MLVLHELYSKQCQIGQGIFLMLGAKVRFQNVGRILTVTGLTQDSRYVEHYYMYNFTGYLFDGLLEKNF